MVLAVAAIAILRAVIGPGIVPVIRIAVDIIYIRDLAHRRDLAAVVVEADWE